MARAHYSAMEIYLKIAQLAVAVLLVASILLQSKGVGLGGTFGGDGNIYRTKRGAEKVLYRSTVSLSVLFFVLALSHLFLPQF